MIRHFLTIFLILLFFCLPPKALAINPPGPNVKQIPPVIFVRGDWMNGDWGNPNYTNSGPDIWLKKGRPELGPLGGEQEQFCYSKEDGVQNFKEIDAYLNTAKGYTVTLDTGEIISKPVAIAISPLNMEGCSPCYGAEPWAPGCEAAEAKWEDWVRKLGARYDNNPAFSNLYAIIIWAGFDGEAFSQCERGYCGGGYEEWTNKQLLVFSQAFTHTAVLATYVPPSLYGGVDYILNNISNTNVGLKNNSLEPDCYGRTDCGKVQMFYKWPAAGATSCAMGGVLRGGTLGAPMLLQSAAIPRLQWGREPGAGGDSAPGCDWNYWLMIESLSGHPTYQDWQMAYLIGNQIASDRLAVLGTPFDINKFGRLHTAVTINTTPDIWIVMRGAPTGRKIDAYQSGSDCLRYDYWREDYGFWLYRNDSAPQSKCKFITTQDIPKVLPTPAAAHPFSFHSTRATGGQYSDGTVGHYMSFNVDDAYRFANQPSWIARPSMGVQWNITVTILNYISPLAPGGKDVFCLEYKKDNGDLASDCRTKGVHLSSLGQLNQWVDVPFIINDGIMNNGLPGGIDFRIYDAEDGPEYIHRIIASPRWMGTAGEPTPTTCPQASQGDLNCDGKINEIDLTLFLRDQPTSLILTTLLANWKTN